MAFVYAWLGFLSVLFVGLVVVCILRDKHKRGK